MSTRTQPHRPTTGSDLPPCVEVPWLFLAPEYARGPDMAAQHAAARPYCERCDWSWNACLELALGDGDASGTYGGQMVHRGKIVAPGEVPVLDELAVECSKCGAKPGAHCRTPGGHRLGDAMSHLARRQAIAGGTPATDPTGHETRRMPGERGADVE